MADSQKRIPASFYKTESGNEPVREWLKQLERRARLRIGTDIKTVEYGWPIGMPTCKSMGEGLFEVRTQLPSNKIARVLFCIHENSMVSDLALARQRKKKLEAQK